MVTYYSSYSGSPSVSAYSGGSSRPTGNLPGDTSSSSSQPAPQPSQLPQGAIGRNADGSYIYPASLPANAVAQRADGFYISNTGRIIPAQPVANFTPNPQQFISTEKSPTGVAFVERNTGRLIPVDPNNPQLAVSMNIPQPRPGVERLFGQNFTLAAGSVANPIKYTIPAVFQELERGAYTVSGGRFGINQEVYTTRRQKLLGQINQAYDQPLGTFLFKSPYAQLGGLYAGSFVFGGLARQAGVLVSSSRLAGKATIPLIAGSSLLASGVGAQALTSVYASSVANKTAAFQAKGTTGYGGALATTLASEGLNIVSFGKGFERGLEKGLPVMYEQVSVGGVPVSTGFFTGSGRPLYTRTTSLLGPAGKNSFVVVEKGFGSPKQVAFPLLSEAYVPESKAGSVIYQAYARQNLAKAEGEFLTSAVSITSETYGRPSTFYNKEYLKGFFGDAGLQPQTGRALTKFFQRQKDFEIYGSTPTAAQVRGYRQPKDLDVTFSGQSGVGKAGEIVRLINRMEGGSIASQREGQILLRGVKKFDIHGSDLPPEFSAVANPFGFAKQKPVKVLGVPTSRLSQEGVNKLASVGSLQPNRIISPDPVRRMKDVADFYVIQKELGASPKLLSAYKGAALEKFGKDIFKDYPQLIAAASSRPASSAFKAGLGGTLFPSSRGTRAPSSSLRLAPSASSLRSPSLVPSRVPSPSISSRSPGGSLARSLSRSLSRSSYASFGSSPRFSPSPSRAPSSSLRPSISFSPSFSSSPRLSSRPSSSSTSALFPTRSPWIPMRFPKLGRFGDNIGMGKIRTKRVRDYIPSFKALALGIRAPYKKGRLSKTGLDLRPITPQFKISTRKQTLRSII